jgi:hypothetical protein
LDSARRAVASMSSRSAVSRCIEGNGGLEDVPPPDVVRALLNTLTQD